MSAIDIGTLKLRCAPHRRHAAELAIVDAMHTEIADDQRLRLVRRVSIDAAGSASDPARRQAAVRQAWLAATADARHAGVDGAGDANCVWFADRAEAEAMLLARLLAGKSVGEWFWQLALPDWRGAPVRAFLRERLMQTCAARDDPAILAIAEVCVAADATALLVELLTELSRARIGEYASPSIGYSIGESEDAPTMFAAGKVAKAPSARFAVPTPSATLRPIIRQLAKRGAAVRPLLRSLVRADLLRQSPALSLDRAVLEDVAESTLEQILTGEPPPAPLRPSNLGTQVAETASLPGDSIADRPPRVRSISPMEVPNHQIPPGRLSPTTSDQSPDLQSLSAYAAPYAAQHSQHAGLWLIIPSLEYLGFRAWLSARPHLLTGHPAGQLLRAIARHHRIALDDPAIAFIVDHNGADATPDWASRWRVALDRSLRRRARRRLHDLVNRPGFISHGDRAIDIRFPPDAADIRLRRLALDRDPGWVEWLGLSVRYHFRSGEHR